jgi:hypothetical protein
MLRSDALRAKSLQAEVAYLHDLTRVRNTKAQVDQKERTVREREKTFWREATRPDAEVAPDAEVSLVQPPVSGACIDTMRIERLWRAHAQLKSACGEHQLSKRCLNESVEVLRRSGRCRDSVQMMLASAQRRLRIRSEEGRAEELIELATVSHYGPRSYSVTPRQRETQPEPADPRSLTPAEGRGDILGALNPHTPRAVATSETLEGHNPEAPSMHYSAAAGISVESAQMHTRSDRTSFSLSCAVGRHGPLALSLLKEQGAGIKVLVDPSIGRLAPTLVTERGVLQARLNALGIKVVSIQVGRLDDAPAGLERAPRRARRDDDEERIA